MIFFERGKSLRICSSEQNYKGAKTEQQMIHVWSRVTCHRLFLTGSRECRGVRCAAVSPDSMNTFSTACDKNVHIVLTMHK